LNQTTLTRQAVDSASRPYLQIFVDSNAIQQVERVRGEGAFQTIGLQFEILNIGKLPANAKTRSLVQYSATKLSVVPGLDSIDAEARFIWPSLMPYDHLTAYGTDPITPGQFNDIRAGLGYVYFRADAIYGEHFTRVCWELPITPAAAPTGNGPLGSISTFNNCPGKPENNSNAN
jgi:hypothetical protein